MKLLAIVVLIGVIGGSTPINIEQYSKEKFQIAYAQEQSPQEVKIEVRYGTSTEAIERQIREVFTEQPDLLVKIAKCESGLKYNATHTNKNGTTDSGVFQINSTHGLNKPFDPHENIMFAKKLYDERGTQPWKASESCWSK